jgi:hypothetical protein
MHKVFLASPAIVKAKMKIRKALFSFSAIAILASLIIVSAPVFTPAAQALSYNPPGAANYHAPLSTMGLIAVTGAENSLNQQVNNGKASTAGSSNDPAPIASDMTTIPHNGVRFINDTSYMSQSETSVAVSGTDVLGGFNDGRFFVCPFVNATTDCPTGYSYSLSGFTISTDGGQHVAGGDVLPGLVVGRPPNAIFLVSWGDPAVVAVPGSSSFYYASLAISPSTSANGVELSVSNSNLISDPSHCTTSQATPWLNPCWQSTLVFGNTLPKAYTFEDKPTIAVDNSTGSQYYGDAYIAWDHFYKTGTSSSYLARCDPDLHCTMLSGGGKPVVSGSDLFAGFTTPGVGPDGTVYVTWCNFGTPVALTPIDCKVRSSTDGGQTWSSPSGIVTLNNGLSGYATEQFRVTNIPAFAVDNSAASTSGNLYYVIDDCTNGNYYGVYLPNIPGNCGFSDVILASSTDGGATWTNQTLTSSDAVTAQPTVAVDPSHGVVSVAYYTSQNDAYNHRLDVVLQTSNDGGTTWSSRTITNPSIEPDADPAYFYYLSAFGGSWLAPQFGDYMQAVSSGGFTYVLFSATYTAELGTLQTDPYLYSASITS